MPTVTNNLLPTPKVLQGFNLFVDGRGYAAKVRECELPKLTIKTEEFQPGGFDAPVEMDMGLEKLETNFTLLDYDADVLKQFGLGHNNTVPVTLRGALSYGDGTTVPAVVQLQGMFREVEPPKFGKPGKLEMKATMSLKYYKLEINGETIHEIDVENMVRIVGGVDYLASMRENIGA